VCDPAQISGSTEASTTYTPSVVLSDPFISIRSSPIGILAPEWYPLPVGGIKINFGTACNPCCFVEEATLRRTLSAFDLTKGELFLLTHVRPFEYRNLREPLIEESKKPIPTLIRETNFEGTFIIGFRRGTIAASRATYSGLLS
jgi:hypothetical protein